MGPRAWNQKAVFADPPASARLTHTLGHELITNTAIHTSLLQAQDLGWWAFARSIAETINLKLSQVSDVLGTRNRTVCTTAV